MKTSNFCPSWCCSIIWAQVSVEQQYQQLCESWRAELDEKQRQFEQARAQILEPRYEGKQPHVQTWPWCSSVHSGAIHSSRQYAG